MVRICQNFVSLQGEGVRTGMPSLFIRSFGCNLGGCPGFGQKDPADKSTWVTPEYSLTKSPEYGCDSPNSWHKMFENLFPDYETGADLFNDLVKKYKPENFKEIVITGGEPMLHQKFWEQFFRSVSIAFDFEEFYVTFETNGTIKPDIGLDTFIKGNSTTYNDIYGRWNFLFSVSPKLNCVAGVSEKLSINYDTLKFYLDYHLLNIADYQFKFVYNGDDRAYNRITQIYEDLKKFGLDKNKILLMPVGGAKVEQEIKEKTAETCIKEGFRYCERVHVDIWGSKMGV